MKTPASRIVPRAPSARRFAPAHAEIAARAEAIWRERGCPTSSDDEIWLDAERQLSGPPARGKQNLEPRGGDKNPSDDPGLGFNPKNRDMAGELEERFPGAVGKETTAL